MAKTPALPTFKNKKTMYYLVGGTVVLGGIYYYRKKKAAAAAPVTTGAGIDNTQIDAATGFPYGSAQDAAALAAQSNYQNATNYGGGGGPALNGSGGGSTPPIGTGFTNNAQWEQAAIAYLTGNGAPFGDVSSALGKYLNGVAIADTDTAATDYIHQAIAAEGQPPLAGANGYPPSIKNGGTTTSPTPTPTPTGGTIPTPYIRVVSHTATTANLAWDAIPGALRYHLQANGVPYKDTTATSITVPIKAGHIRLAAITAHGNSAYSNQT